MSIVTVGTVAFDAIETPFAKSNKIVGGAATYIAWAASYFTPDVNMVSVIGDDFDMNELKKLQERGVNTDGIELKKGEKSFFWKGKYHMDMNTRDTITTELNVLADFNPILPESYKECDILMLGNIDPNLQISVINQMRRKPKLIVMDSMNFWMDITPEALEKAISMADVLTINDSEARLFSNEYSLVKAAKALMKMGPKYIIIKKGEHGCLLFYENAVFCAPALPLEDVFDPTGAGDTFAGGFVGWIDKTKDISYENLKTAVMFGSAMASFCVEKLGTERLQQLTDEEINQRLSEFIQLMQVDIDLVN